MAEQWRNGRLVDPVVSETICVHHVGLTPGLWCGACNTHPGHPDRLAPVTEDAPRSDPDLLDAYRKQLAYVEPDFTPFVFMAWQGQPGITPDDLIDEFKRAKERDADG